MTAPSVCLSNRSIVTIHGAKPDYHRRRSRFARLDSAIGYVSQNEAEEAFYDRLNPAEKAGAVHFDLLSRA